MQTQTFEPAGAYAVPAQTELLRQIINELQSPIYNIPAHHIPYIEKPEIGEPYIRIADLKITAFEKPHLRIYRVYLLTGGSERIIAKPLNIHLLAFWISEFINNNNLYYAYKKPNVWTSFLTRLQFTWLKRHCILFAWCWIFLTCTGGRKKIHGSNTKNSFPKLRYPVTHKF